MESRDGDTRKKRKGTPAPPSRKTRKPTGAAPPLSLAPAPSMRMGPGDGGAPTARTRSKPTGAAAPPPSRASVPPVRMGPVDGGAPTARRRSKPTGAAAPPPSRASVPPVRMGPGDGGAPTARRRSKPTCAAAPPPSLAPAPSVRMARGDGGAPTGGRTRKPTGASVPPSLAPTPSVRMGLGNGGAPTERRRRRKPTGTAAPPSLAPAPSVRMGLDNGGAPTERRRRGKPTGTAAPPCPTPPASVRMAHGDQGTPPERKRKGSSSLREGMRGWPERSSIRNNSAVWHGGPQKSYDGDSSESSAGEDDTCEDLAGHSDDPNGSGADGAGQEISEDDDSSESLAWEDDTLGVLARHGDNPIGSGAVGAGHTHGSPDALAALSDPSKNVATHGKIVVAHTPNTPPRFEGLLRIITSLIPCENKGKSYECSLGQMNAFLRWSQAENAFFFEWSDDKMEMTCWMHNINKGQTFKFTVNAAFSHKMDNLSVERAAVAFSENFIGDDKYWSDLKDTLLIMFGSFEDKDLKDYDYLYVFTRVGESIGFRNFKITSLPKAGDSSSKLVLKEINTNFSLKLADDQVTPNNSYIGAHLKEDETLSLCEVTLYGISNGQTGSCLFHHVDFNGTIYSIALRNGTYLSTLEKLQGFNTSLAEIVVIEPSLKMKHIIGSATNKTYCFVRERFKSILQSLFAEVATLLESGKCISETSHLFMHNILVRGTSVRLYGLDLTDYSDDLAKLTVEQLVVVVRKCFPIDTIPIDLHELLEELEENPLDGIRIAEDDCSLLKAEERRKMLIDFNSEYMTNVEEGPADSDRINEITFFEDCPYAADWDHIMKDNEYMVQVGNMDKSNQKNEADEDNNDKNAVKLRMEKKHKLAKNTASIKKFADKKKLQLQLNRGSQQFSSKRNFLMHMPEKAKKDGIIPFRLGMSDHILTAYFPKFLRFVQKRMRDLKAQRGIFKKRSRPGLWARGQRQ